MLCYYTTPTRSSAAKVYGLCDGFDFFVERGAYAEYLCVPEQYLALMPDSLDFKQAASIPLVALTAYQVLAQQRAAPSACFHVASVPLAATSGTDCPMRFSL